MSKEAIQRAAEMKRLSDDDREAAIKASSNVVGFGIFTERTKQVALRRAYRKPKGPAPGGRA